MVMGDNTDLWRELHRPSEENPVCECAGDHICCPCTLTDALDELARLRASHARLLEALRAILDDPEAGINITLIARAAIAAAVGDPETRVLKAMDEIDTAIAAADGGGER